MASKREKILELLALSPTPTTKEMAERLRVKKATLLKQLQRMAGGKDPKIKGIGKTTNRIYVLSDVLSPELVTSQVHIYKDTSKLEPKPSPTSKLRLHRLYRSYPLLEEARLEGARQIGLRNTTQEVIEFENITLRKTSRHIVVEGIRLACPLGTIAPQLLLWAEQQADGALARAMQRYRINADIGKGETRLVELALTEYDVAKKSKLRGSVPFYWNPETNLVEVWGDTSHNIGEWETNRTTHAQKLQKLTKDVVEDRWSTHSQIKINQELIERDKKNSELIARYARQIELHLKVMKRIDERLSQRRLFE